MYSMKNLILIGFLLLHSLVASATPDAATQDHTQIRSVAIAFVQQQSAAFPGKVTYKVDEIDPRIAMPSCAQLEAFLPAGSQFVGKTSIGVRCVAKHGWNIFIPVQINVSRSLLISAQQLPLGHILQEQDLSILTTETSLTEGFTDPKQVLGKVLRYGIAAGQVLREDMLRLPFSVTQGQIVKLIAQGDGFNIRSEGAALSNASEGQSVQVRIASGRVIGGVAHDNGIVEIRP